ncbi:protein-L-isoaspartate O-methyltransferase family protein [Arenibaculum pallidiluteum]|uniref:protein-L-isoaspartate O-methyltransferase family protein n=1 Tax=Arenibaculum pallidiluteum TaxID=2812559 RepID=UPI001A960A8A|nr:protein-L-isoaspartate O-methyltransferase [Arenibaculum pallidiluteum]
MPDYAAARFHMVEGQIRTNKVTDEALVEALRSTPREAFVPKAFRGIAYVDEGIQIAPGRFLMEPMLQAWLLEAAQVRSTDVVLDIGCGTGYSTALLARLAATVVALESDPALAAQASAVLGELGIDNAAVVQGPLVEGYPRQAPYDLIVIEGAVAEVPQAILDQVAEGGRLVAVVAPDGRIGRVRLFRKLGGVVSSIVIADGGTPMLPGFEPKPAFEF